MKGYFLNFPKLNLLLSLVHLQGVLWAFKHKSPFFWGHPVVLGISSKCPYQTLLHVTQIAPALATIKKTKIMFVNELMNIKAEGLCRDALLQEQKTGMKGGLLNEVKAICKEWKIQDVTGSYVNPKQLKTEIENAIKHKVLIETFKAKSAPFHHIPITNKYREYFEASKERSMLGLAYDVGCLNLRGHRKSESMKRFGSYQCLIPGCTGEDMLQHIMTDCQGYLTKRYKNEGNSSEFIDYLFKLNEIRKTRFTTSMINWKSGK